MSELKTESLENFMAAKPPAGPSPSTPPPGGAPQDAQAGAGSGPTGGGGGAGGDTPPQGSLAEVVPGAQLGRYRIIKRLGEGGMSAVFEAVHMDIHKPVAIKVLSNALAQQQEAQVRFLREAAAASRLQHPNVVDVSDFGTDNGRYYLVMELMRGEDLSQHIQRKGPIPAMALADIMLPICAGVHAAHEMKIVHRDLKPQNIFLCRAPTGGTVPKVLDFGISKVVDAEAAALTHSGMMMGTPYYLSPEQIIQNQADHRSDQYALGVILYECATGRRPHEAETLYGILNSITQGSYPRPRALRPEMTEPFEMIILRTLAQDPARRYPTVHALGAALMPYASDKQRMFWSDFFASDVALGHEDVSPPVVSTPAGKSGSTELLRNDGSGSMPHNATRILPDASQSSAAMRKQLSASQTNKNTFAGVDEDAIASVRGRPKGVIIGVAAGVVLLVGILIYAFSGSKKVETTANAPAPKTEATEGAEAVPAQALPPPVATKPIAEPAEVAPAKAEEQAAQEPAKEPSRPTTQQASRDSSSSRHSSRSGKAKTPDKTPPAAAAPAHGDPASAGKRGVEKSGNVPILD